MNRLPSRLVLVLALLAPVAFAQGPTQPEFPAGPPNFPPKSRADWRELRHESAKRPAATEAAATRVRFSDPAKPATLRVVLPLADVRITGADGDEVVVVSSLDPQAKAGEVDADGFRRLDEDVAFDLKEKDNVVTLSLAGEMQVLGHGAEFELRVPRRTNVVVRSQLGGEIEIVGVDGEIEVNGMNSEVTLTDIGTSAVVSTMNGEVVAKFRQAPAKPVSITSMNGDIDLQLPAATKANVRLRTHHGSVRTNFPADALVTKTERAPGRGPAGYAIGPDATADEIRAAARDAEAMAREMAQDAARMAREVAAEARVAAAAQVRAARNAARAGTAPAEAPEAPEPPATLNALGALEPADAPEAPVPPVPSFGGRSIVGALNGGGVEVALSSMNGTITLRAGK